MDEGKVLREGVLEGAVLWLYGRRVRWRRFFENVERMDEGKVLREGVLEGAVLWLYGRRVRWRRFLGNVGFNMTRLFKEILRFALDDKIDS